MKKNVLLVFATVFVTLGLLAVGAFGFWFVQRNIQPNKSENGPLLPTPTLAEVFSPSPEKTIAPEVTIVPTVTLAAKSDLQLISEAFGEKYGKPAGDVDVNISENTGTYVKGGVRFAGELGGGWFLAFNDGSGWIIVADGNGSVMCADIEGYNFPVSMVPECWDKATSSIVTR